MVCFHGYLVVNNMAYFKDLETQNAHPGWAVYFEDGTWLSTEHGFTRIADAYAACIYNAKENAEQILDLLRESKTEGKYFSLPAQIIEAWQPVCETLRLEVNTLKQANVVSYMDLRDMHDELSTVLDKVKGWLKKV